MDDSGTNTPLLLTYQKPFNFKEIISFIKRRAIKGIEMLTDDTYARTFRTDRTKGFFTVKDIPEQSALALRINCNDIKCYMEIHNRVRRMFDLDTDFIHINQRFKKDKRLSKGMENDHVPRLPIAFDPFEFALRAVLGQQISVKAASTLAARIGERAELETEADFPSGLDFFFPDPSEILQMDLDGLGITKARQRTIKNIAEGIINRRFSLTANQSFETFQKQFSALKGIGDWTVNYVAMRGLGMVDSFPASDLGIIKAMTTSGKKPTQKQILNTAESWRPYRAYAALCLWNS